MQSFRVLLPHLSKTSEPLLTFPHVQGPGISKSSRSSPLCSAAGVLAATVANSLSPRCSRNEATKTQLSPRRPVAPNIQVASSSPQSSTRNPWRGPQSLSGAAPRPTPLPPISRAPSQAARTRGTVPAAHSTWSVLPQHPARLRTPCIL